MPSATASYSVWRAFSAPVGSWKIICARRRCSRSPRSAVRERLAAEAHLAGVRPLEAHDRAGERRLAAAGLAHERQRLALVNGEVHPVHRPRRAVAPGVVHVQAAAPPGAARRASRRHRRAWHVHARRLALVPGRPQLDGRVRADLDRDRAARMERAAARQMTRVRRVAGKPGRAHAERRVADHGERGGERARVRVHRVGEDLVVRAPPRRSGRRT